MPPYLTLADAFHMCLGRGRRVECFELTECAAASLVIATEAAHMPTFLSIHVALPHSSVVGQHSAHVQVQEEGRRLSAEAYEASKQQTPEMEFEPPGGPLEEVVPPPATASQPAQPGKYHVVVTADFGKYGRWQTLVRSGTLVACWWARSIFATRKVQ